jgi:hypothetical protein
VQRAEPEDQPISLFGDKRFKTSDRQNLAELMADSLWIHCEFIAPCKYAL